MRRPHEATVCNAFEANPEERCVLITTRSASSGVPRSIFAQREGHAHGGESSALPGKPIWRKLSFRYDPSGECRIKTFFDAIPMTKDQSDRGLTVSDIAPQSLNPAPPT
jgi:hypothetical protein